MLDLPAYITEERKKGSRFGMAVTFLRDQRNWSVEDLAERVRIEPDQLLAIEEGGSVPEDVFIRLGETFGFSEEDIRIFRRSTRLNESPEEPVESFSAFFSDFLTARGLTPAQIPQRHRHSGIDHFEMAGRSTQPQKI